MKLLRTCQGAETRQTVPMQHWEDILRPALHSQDILSTSAFEDATFKGVVVETSLQYGYRRSLENCNSRDLQDLQSHCRAPQTEIVFVFAILCIMNEGIEKGAVSSGFQKLLIPIAASLKKSFLGAQKWTLSQITAGLWKVHCRHVLENACDSIAGIPVSNPLELEEMLEWIYWALAAYKKDSQSLATFLQINEQDVVKMVPKSAVLQPAYFVAIHHKRKSVVMGIRGTNTTSDLLTDLHSHSVPFCGGVAHAGMLTSAQWLLNHEAATLCNILLNHSGYKLVLTGHSLGGSIASLLTMLVRETGGGTYSTSLKIRPSKIFCWGYGSAPCVDRTLATSANFICNVVLQDDLVARLSPASIEVLRREIQDTGWSDALKEGRIKTIVEKLEKAELGAFNMETLMVTKNRILSQVATVAGRQSCSPVNTVQNFVYTGDDVSSSIASSSLISTSSTHARSHLNWSSREHTGISEMIEAGMSNNKINLERRRHYLPGILYHIMRKQSEAESSYSSTTVHTPPHVCQNSLKAPTKMSAAGSRYVVIRATDPTSRFGRIVLSNTILSDHSCFQYIEGMSDALNTAHDSWTPHHLLSNICFWK